MVPIVFDNMPMQHSPGAPSLGDITGLPESPPLAFLCNFMYFVLDEKYDFLSMPLTDVFVKEILFFNLPSKGAPG